MPFRLMLSAALLVLAGCSGNPDNSDTAAEKPRPGGQRIPAEAPARMDVPTGPRPNIVFVLVDTLRADRLGVYGGPLTLTPVMDEIAAEGTVFERGIAAAPWTLPSVASLFSGVYPTVHRANDYNIALKGAEPTDVSVRVLSSSITTLAERLSASGYETGGFVANIFLSAKFGLHQGFDHYDASFVANTTPGSVVNLSFTNWLKLRQSDAPFFAYLHYMDVHAPYTDDQRFVQPLVQAVNQSEGRTTLARDEMNRHPGYFGKSAKPFLQNPLHSKLFETREYWWARYDAGIAQTDFFLGELRDELRKLDLWDDTLVIITSDHGEALGEHGLWTHGLSAHQDQLHVPMIVRWPDHIPAGERRRQSVRMFDLFPTVLDYLNLPREESLQAASLRGLLDGGDTADRLALGEAVKEAPGRYGLVLGKWKLLADRASDYVELFDLDVDPNEKNNIAEQHPDVVRDLLARAKALFDENTARAGETGGTRRGVTPEELERLKTLGYVGDD